MEFLYLKTFVQVLKSGSYSRAAIDLDYAQSSVTNHIQKLEELYGGVRLFERKGKQMKATSSGELLYDYAVKILSLYQDSHSAIGDQEIKTLTIGSIETVALYFLPEILDKFKKLYPDVHIRIIPSNERNIIQMIKEKEIDFGLILDFPYYIPEVENLLLEKQPMGIVVPHDHKFANRRELEIKDLTDESFILTEKGCTYRAFLLEKLNGESISHDISMELSSVETIKKAIKNHWGIGFLPLFAVEENDQFLKTVPLNDTALNFHRQLLYRKEKKQLNVFNSFIDICLNSTISK
ncbi:MULTISPECIES: LysR family transcriptional regulator [Heyndrickxia]|uniref:LysR family transcriptional regulator n=1 Tax=Heyndrickxia TaxID=2837504 RepID=UPI000825223B|nr:LysR family transcriptional regulator [Heyndrickxia sporothermodurans]MED3652402.1 LysR family transcriptional regulator [Heyndrickxia sporothermodurans]MED3699327.1 LysR family transcriptional regulator [Heyndrickxia sporothermodurans]MED3782698.1 LysR family transcriptional regulator [Heyndrickxia sporothermodurans]